MNVLAYSSQQPEKVGPKVEDLLRNELALAAPIHYDVEPSGAAPTGLAGAVADGVKLLFGRAEAPLFTLNFSVKEPRAAQVQVRMNRQGVGCHAGTLLYSTQLAKRVGGEVTLDDATKKARFTGDPAAAARLNANAELLKRANDFARTQTSLGGVSITAPRFLKIVPSDGGSALVAATLAQPRMMGFKVSMASKEFFELAAMIESAL